MNHISPIQSCAVVLVGSYTRKNLRRCLKHPMIRKTHCLLKDWSNYPVRNGVYRIEVELREKINLGNFIRPADLYDLVRFASLHPEMVLEHGPVECFDHHLDNFGKETGISSTIPFVSFSGGKIEVSLDYNNRNPQSICQLVVTEQMFL